ncbi:MAG: hypothetical protein LBM02_06800 [Lachnospiraceae bacterium]|jgi:hypothetical protein|nr:hypothetical protein [Lachnospiraceae bacterium]
MTVKEVYNYYKDKEQYPCQLTEELIKAGYQQPNGGYISYALENEMEVNYKKSVPNQWWHLIKSYCGRTNMNKNFPKSIQCGELIFWMAEVSECVDRKKLNDLKNRIIENAKKDKNGIIKDRNKWNREILNLCQDAIYKYIENYAIIH